MIKARALETGFRHESLPYRNASEFLAVAAPFVTAGLDAGEPVLVMTSDRNIGLLGRELGSLAAAVRFAAIEEVGRNPARLIPFWRDFFDEHGGAPVRALEEPALPGRGSAELEECELHNSLLDVAFSADPISFLCAYEIAALPPRSWFADRLAEPPAGASAFAFDRGGLSDVRRRVERAAEAGGLAGQAAGDLIVAASELAANSVAHGGGRGVLRSWREGDCLLIEVADAGQIEEPLAGRLRPAVTQEGGRGLWLANQLCDLVQIRSGSAGTTVRLRVALDSGVT